jgi:hypothetical protein
MIRGLLIFFSSLIILSAAQIKLSCIENEPAVQQNNSWQILVADHLTFEAAEHPGQLGDIRIQKEKTSKLRTTNIYFWFVTERVSNQFRFCLSSENVLASTYESGHFYHTGALPLYLELNKILI